MRAASLLARRGHVAEGLRLSLRALDSALAAGQLKSGLNEPALALRALGMAPPSALDVLRRARTLDMPTLDAEVAPDVHELGREVREVARQLLDVSAPDRSPSLFARMRSWLSVLLGRLRQKKLLSSGENAPCSTAP